MCVSNLTYYVLLSPFFCLFVFFLFFSSCFFSLFILYDCFSFFVCSSYISLCTDLFFFSFLVRCPLVHYYAVVVSGKDCGEVEIDNKDEMGVVALKLAKTCS